MRLKDHFCKNIESPPEAIIQKLVEAGDNWMDGRNQDDDITFVVIRVK
jgi:serine phosphatase RsbU (regulator of sigma subunit)